MSFTKRYLTALLTALGAVASTSVVADIWVFEPSVTLDQRFDDNYYLSPDAKAKLSATRGIGELGVSREASDYVLKGLARIDTLFTTNTDVGDEDLDYNWIGGIEARRSKQRSRYGVRVNYKQDTPSRDIAADISDNSAIAEDTGLLVTQSLSSNVAREEYTIEPSFEYDISRRLQFDVSGAVSSVKHELPEAQDAIYQQYLGQRRPNEGYPIIVDGIPTGEYSQTPLPYEQVSIDNINGRVFSPAGELDDFLEAEIEVGIRFKFTPIVTLSATAAYSNFTAQVLPAPEVFFSEDNQFIVDKDVRQIRRKPRRDLVSTTTTFKLGYERFLTPTLLFGLDGGVYVNTTDNSDTFRAGDIVRPVDPEVEPVIEPPEVGKTESDGWLASTSLIYDAGATRYSARFAVDVQPSSAGAQVETNELTGEFKRILSRRLNFSLRGRAFEPDRLGARSGDRFARRFISFEPRVEWKYTRNWTLSAAYRYRRQKAQVDPESAESNAILLAVKYTPPSELRDRARANGL